MQSHAEIMVERNNYVIATCMNRGKPHGHDVDLLLSHPETNITDVLLENLLACLRKNVTFIVLH